MTAPTPFRIGHFRAFWVAILVSNLGTMIQGVGAAGLMTSLTTLAGALGFEPRNGGTKNRCLTTWRRPNGRVPTRFG